MPVRIEGILLMRSSVGRAIFPACFLLLISMSPLSDLDRAEKLYRAGSIHSARVLFRNIYLKDKQCAKAAFYLGRITENGDSSAFYLKESIRNPGLDEKSSNEAKLGLCRYYYAKGAYNRVVDIYPDILKNPGKQTNVPRIAIHLAARSMMAMGSCDTAAILFRYLSNDSVSDSSGMAAAIAGLGEIELKLENYTISEKFFKQAIELGNREGLPEYLYGLYRVYDKTDDKEKAKQVRERLKIDFPNNLFLYQIDGPGVAVQKEPVTGVGNYWIQIGAFSKSANAKRLVMETEKKLTLPKGISFKISPLNKLKAVRIGPFVHEKEALDWGLEHVRPSKIKFRVVKEK